MSEWWNRVYLGSSEHMAEIPERIVDALCTDPPAGIAFMGKAWDAHASRQHFIDELRPIFVECLRVMKPGAHGFIWALPRTSHWTMTALEDAGFEIRDVVVHLFGSGFPKSLDVSKAIDEAAGAKRKVVATERMKRMASPIGQPGSGYALRQPQIIHEHTVATTEDAKRWEGWGTALKPAAEHWILVRKPIANKNVAASVLEHGTGALNIDASRIAGTPAFFRSNTNDIRGGRYAAGGTDHQPEPATGHPAGRWPANVTFSHNADCEQIGTRTVRGDEREGGDGARDGGFYDVGSESGDGKPVGALYGDEEVPIYRCSDGCAVAALDAQSGTLHSGAFPEGAEYDGSGYMGGWSGASTLTYGDTGGASRFFYVAKPPGAEKNAMPGAIKNTHPTVKPLGLMCYLIRMITPPGGIVLDPFAGSGTTLVAAESMGFRWVGYEREAEYRDIALARLSQRSLFGDGVA